MAIDPRKILALVGILLISFSASAIDINGAGSSAAMPLYTKWAEHYSRTEGAKISYQSIGSSAGIKKIKERAIDFGASDVALSLEDLNREKLICFPSAISGVVPVVHIAGLKNGQLQLSGQILADIFMHKITKWNDPAIVALNPDIALPKAAIVTIVRQDGSGTTYNFTDYLSKVSPSWKAAFGKDFTIKWPAAAMQVKGSSGISALVKQTPGAIGYIDYNYVTQDQLTYAKLQNHDGKFVAPAPEGFASALQNSSWRTKATFEEMLTDKPGIASWPITMGTFIIVPVTAKDPEGMSATLKFFSWAFMHGDHIVNGIDFVRLPDRVQARIFKEMTKITDTQGKPLQWAAL
ncbi:MAG: phosphate ABC transporter substrate-binding protein PstS [Burkholderiaceae bacterium]